MPAGKISFSAALVSLFHFDETIMTGMLHQDTALFICLFGRNPNHRRRHQSDAITNKQSIHQMERETILKERPRYCLMDQDSCQQSIDLFMWNIKILREATVRLLSIDLSLGSSVNINNNKIIFQINCWCFKLRKIIGSWARWT